MAPKIEAKLQGKLTFAFKNNLKNLADFHRLKNSDFILESKMTELNQIKIQNNQVKQMQYENFILHWK